MISGFVSSPHVLVQVLHTYIGTRIIVPENVGRHTGTDKCRVHSLDVIGKSTIGLGIGWVR